MGVSMVRISHKNCGLTVVVMGSGRRMKTGAKHREQNQELENNARDCQDFRVRPGG